LNFKLNSKNVLRLKDNLQKILSNNKLKKMCFDYNNGKEPRELQDIVDKLSTKNKNVPIKEALNFGKYFCNIK